MPFSCTLSSPAPAFSKDVGGTKLRLVCCGAKGDWPFLRKVFELNIKTFFWVPLNTFGVFGIRPLWKIVVLMTQAFALSTGFTSKRICHRCNSEDKQCVQFSCSVSRKYHNYPQLMGSRLLTQCQLDVDIQSNPGGMGEPNRKRCMV